MNRRGFLKTAGGITAGAMIVGPRVGFPQATAIAGSLYQMPNDNNSAETCPLYNMLKLSRNLFFHDPDPQYMNF